VVLSPVPEPSPLVGNGLHPIAHHDVIGPKRLVAHRHRATSQYSARPPLAHPIGSLEMGDSIPLGGGRYHFFPRRSFSAALSSMLSASSFLNRAFSSSSAFRRRASLMSMPPYLAFHLQTLALLTPCLRHRSATGTTASCSFNIAMICSSVNLVRFVSGPSDVARAYFKLD
jgi:hypothetical protein